MPETVSRRVRLERIRDHLENTQENARSVEGTLAAVEVTPARREQLEADNARREQSICEWKEELRDELR